MAPADEPPKRVTKRVVKKTVVKRPVADQPAPTVRYGRPSRAASPAPAQRGTAAKAAPPRTRVTTPKAPRELGKKAGGAVKAVGHRTGKAAAAVAGGIRSAGSTTVSAFGAARAYRLPRMDQTLASAIVGVLVGATTVGVTILFSMGFSQLRGTSTGGGRWGFLAVIIVTFIAFAIGASLLAGLHVGQPRVTSALAVCLTLFAIMAFFLRLDSSVWAWLVVPLLGAATYALAHRAIAAADSSRAQPE